MKGARLYVAVAAWVCVAGCSHQDATPEAQPNPSAPRAAGSTAEATEQTFVRLMELVGDQFESDLAGWPETEFATQAEAFEVLFELSPLGSKMQEYMTHARAELGLRADALAQFITENPAVVEREAKVLAERLAPAKSNLVARIADTLKELPPGDLKAAREDITARVYERGGDQPQNSEPADWSEIESLDDLRAEVGRAVARDQPIIIHFRAEWARPTIDLERDVFENPTVRERLAGFSRLYVDLTALDGATDEVQVKFAASAIPAVHVFPDPAPLALFLDGASARPENEITIREALAPAAFLEELATAR